MACCNLFGGHLDRFVLNELKKNEYWRKSSD